MQNRIGCGAGARRAGRAALTSRLGFGVHGEFRVLSPKKREQLPDRRSLKDIVEATDRSIAAVMTLGQVPPRGYWAKIVHCRPWWRDFLPDVFGGLLTR